MAGLADLLAGNIGTDQQYQAQDPFFLAGMNIAKTPLAAPQDNTQALLLPALQGLLSGGLIGYGKDQARQAQYKDYSASPLMQALSSSQNIGPVADAGTYANELTHSYGQETAPAGWTGKIGQSDLITALQQKEQADDLKSKVTSSVLDSAVKDGSLTPGQALDVVSGKTPSLQATLGAQAVGENPRLSAQLDAYKITDPGLRASLRTQDALDSYVVHRAGAKDPALETKLRSEWVADKLYQSAGVLAPLSKAAEDVAALKTPAGDLGLVDVLAKAFNPGGVIRPQFVSMIKDAQNPLNKYAGDIDKVMGGGSFNDDTRQQMIDAVKSRVNDGLQAAKMVADSKLAIAAHGNLDSENIIPKSQYDTLFGGLSPDPVGMNAPAASTARPGMELRTAPDGSKFYVRLGQ